MSFHDVLFPTDISRGSRGGPERRTEIVVLGSGREERNARWADSRRTFNAGYGVKSLDQLNAVISFFEQRRGRLHGFRWRDHTDCKSCLPSATPSALDQAIGVGTGAQSAFQLIKAYGSGTTTYARTITKPVAGSVLIAVTGVIKAPSAYTVDHATGIVSFAPGHTPVSGAAVTAGFMFDVPVRFDTDRLEIDLTGFSSGAIPSIPLVEVRT